VATSEPVVLHHGREGDAAGGDEVRPSVFNGLLGGATFRLKPSSEIDPSRKCIGGPQCE
jgi:hypothetical protein